MEKKTLRICLEKDLPSILKRNKNYLYLVYDKLILFFGQNQYYNPFIICDSMPESPIAGCLYILLDGSVKAYIGDSIVDIAEIESPYQLKYLKLLGTTYFIWADRRYLDLQRRTLQLPYHNGTYSMTVSLAKDLKINDKTVVRYDASSENFYIDGEYDGIPDLRRYKDKETDTVKMHVNDNCIHADIKISDKLDNTLKIVDGGLYATIDEELTNEDYLKLLEEYESYKKQTEEIINALKEEVSSIDGVISENSILKMVQDSIESYYSDIDNLIEYYSTIQDKLKELEINCNKYTDIVFEDKSTELKGMLSNGELWGIF